MKKSWTETQDQTLKMLRQERKIAKWSEISKIMASDYGLKGRTQKQCRERYHNHLDSSIKNSKLNPEQQLMFFSLHDQIGNKWMLIAEHFDGFTDNFLKNIYHCKLRTAIRKLNRSIKLTRPQGYRPYPLQIVYSIIEACEKNKYKEKAKNSDGRFYLELKNKLLEYSGAKTVHRLVDGLGEKDIQQQLQRDLKRFEGSFLSSKRQRRCDQTAKITASSEIYRDSQGTEKYVNYYEQDASGKKQQKQQKIEKVRLASKMSSTKLIEKQTTLKEEEMSVEAKVQPLECDSKPKQSDSSCAENGGELNFIDNRASEESVIVDNLIQEQNSPQQLPMPFLENLSEMESRFGYGDRIQLLADIDWLNLRKRMSDESILQLE